MPPSSELPLAFLAENGGNGMCHCRHVTDLMGAMPALGTRVAALEAARGRAPFIGSADRATPDAFHGVSGGFAPPTDEAWRAETLDSFMWSQDGPLQEGSLGLFSGDKFDRPVFDDKTATDSEM